MPEKVYNMLVVIDTNILVSALWSKNGAPARVLAMVLNGQIKPCYDYRILSEYRNVLSRPKFKFSESDVRELIGFIEAVGISVVPEPLDVDFIDEDDRKFYEVSKYCNAILITGNTKHFPAEPMVMTAAEFLE